MANYLAYRDGGKTNEKGISQHLQGMFSGEVINGLQAQQNGTPNMSVNITKGRCMIDSGDDYPYLGFTDSSTTNVTIATADGSNPRIDTVVGYVDLSVVSSATSNNPNAFKLKSVAGTPAGSPVEPNNAAIEASIGSGNPYIKLANVSVAAGTTTITNGNITDKRTMASATIADSAVTADKIAIGTIVKTDSTTNRTIGSTLGSLSETIQITAGTWEIWFNVAVYYSGTSNISQGAYVGLSTSTSSYSHPALRSAFYIGVDTGGSGTKVRLGGLQAREIVTVSSTTTFTLIGQRSGSADATLAASEVPTALRARKISSETS